MLCRYFVDISVDIYLEKANTEYVLYVLMLYYLPRHSIVSTKPKALFYHYVAFVLTLNLMIFLIWLLLCPFLLLCVTGQMQSDCLILRRESKFT